MVLRYAQADRHTDSDATKTLSPKTATVTFMLQDSNLINVQDQ